MTHPTATPRNYLPTSHYYVQGHPALPGDLFRDEQDYATFLNMLKRYLRVIGAGRLELEAFCLLPNDYYICLYQRDAVALQQFIRLTGVAYSSYFTHKYGLPGPLYRQHYRASLISKPAHLIAVSRYIHRLPGGYREWPWSSLPYYIGLRHAEWLRPERVFSQSPGYYSRFVAAGLPSRPHA